jgi:hypothetical protein
VTLTIFFELCEPLAVILMLVVLGLLSQRLGAVTKFPPLYRGLYLGAVLVGVSALFKVLYMVSDNETFILFYDVAFVFGLLLSVIIAGRYWGWLLNENQAQ